MKQFILLLKSFRLLNVFSMLLLLVGLRFYFWKHITIDYNFEQSHFDFFLLLLTVGLISSAGYLVNDIFDVKVDKINKPEKRLAYSNSILWSIYIVVNVLAIFLVLYITESSFVQIILFGTIVLLFLYSFLFQKLPLLGNLAIALLAGVLPLLHYLVEFISYDYIVDLMLFDNRYLMLCSMIPIIPFYVLFGFGVTLLRELVKDIEDIKGDKNSNYKTLPVLVGIKGSQTLFYVLVFLFVIGLFYLNNIINNFLFDAIYYYLLTFMFLSGSIFQVYKANFSKASLFLKLTLFSGVLILFIL